MAKGRFYPDSAAGILKSACDKLDLEGVSAHFFRRTALTKMSNVGIPPRVIQQISGHRSLGVLQEYLEVTPEQVQGVASSLSLLGYSGYSVDDPPSSLEWEQGVKNEERESLPGD